MLDQHRWPPGSYRLHNCRWPWHDELPPVPVPELILPQPAPEVKEQPTEVPRAPDAIPCLPASVRITRDRIYDEVSRVVTYGEPRTLHATPIDQQDLALVLRTPETVGPGSILFCRERWWEVVVQEGDLVTCRPSAIQPSFARS